MLLEVIAFNIDSCILIEKSGAQRIELCDNPGEGGTTPSYGMIKEARRKTGIGLFPIIRPRGGDFLYSNDEFEIIKADIKQCKLLGCDGVVTGMLNTGGTIDKRCAILVEIAYPMEITFHRAFDRVKNAVESLEEIIRMGFTRLLTSGLQPTAMEGIDTITGFIKQANDRIIIMPGSGVRSDNIRELIDKTGATEYHTSARQLLKSRMNFQGNIKEQLDTVTVDEGEVKKIIELMST